MTTLNTPELPIAVSCGDPAGIGPDIILSAFQRCREAQLPPFFVFGDPDQLAHRAAKLGIDNPIISMGSDAVAVETLRDAVHVWPLTNKFIEAPGEPSKSNGAGVVEAIERGVQACFDGQAAGLVTAPIAKSVLYRIGFAFPGHTEFLAELSQKHTGKPTKPVMMIAGPELRTIPVTIHIPLADVASALNAEDIIATARIAAADLRTRFGIEHPRLAISGLNPHAGEDGALGSEDRAIVTPAVQKLKDEGINARGPLPADTMFHDAARQTYDVAICMYHDQALIPAKALGFDDGVNVTLGLPFIRTSPDHGTAFSLAGTGKAIDTSFIAALRMAAEMAAQ